MALFILAQCNIDWFILLYDTQIFPDPIMRLLQPSLQLNICNVGAQVKRIFSNQGDSDTFNTTLHTFADLGCNRLPMGVGCNQLPMRVSWGQGMFITISFRLLPFKKLFSTESAE